MKRDLIGKELAFARERFIDLGICPNTGNHCENLGSLCMARAAARDSMAMVPSDEDNPTPGRKAVEDGFWEAADELNTAADLVLSDTEACDSGCPIES